MTDFLAPSDLIHWMIKRLANKACPPNPTMIINCSGDVAIEAGKNGNRLTNIEEMNNAPVPMASDRMAIMMMTL